MRMIASRMSLPESGTGCKTTEDHTCFHEDICYSASFHAFAIEWLSFWLFLVASSYFLLSSIQGNYCSCCRVKLKPEEKVSSSTRSIPIETPENVATAANDMLIFSESSESPLPHRTSSSMYKRTRFCTESEFDVKSKISDLDRANYWQSLISLEEEDSAWLSDGCSSENPSSPLSYNSGSFTDISELDTPGYWDSLLRLDQREDSKWISESSEFHHRTSSSMSHSTGLYTDFECSFYSEISDLDGASYIHSLLSLEEEDSEWLSDSMTSACLSENPSSPLSYSCDSFTDIDSPSYWDSLLKLDQREEESEWFSDSKRELEYERGSMLYCKYQDDNISVEHLLGIADIEEFSRDEPLFWPLEEKCNWNFEESSFCSSPRRRLEFDFETSSLSTWSKSSARTITLGSFLNEEFDSNMNLPLRGECFSFDQEFPIETLLGLKEFDGYEGLDSEFISDVFVLEEYLE